MSLVEALLLGLLALVLLLLILIWTRLRSADASAELGPWLSQNGERLDRLDRDLRDELARSSGGTRQELLATLTQFQQSLLAQGGDVARTQNEQIDSFRVQLAQLQQALGAQALAARESQDAAGARLSSTLAEQLQLLGQRQEQRLTQVQAAVDQRLSLVQAAVDQRLGAIQQDNEKKLEQMRATVDEKLQATLEQRLGESFKQVAERLEQVHKGLGEMQTLARDVGALNRVLTNVKTRGIFGEVQLAGLLEQVFTPEQYASNVATVPGSSERVEYAIRLPGQRDDGAPLWLPIDAKFPREDYERLLEAQDRADAAAVEVSAKAIETRLRLEAKTIRDKYIAPPHTTDFGMLFVPTEGLYAEALRRPGLVESLQREHKVMLVGPTTLLATLTSLQMGFRTLALEKRSAEVWEVLGAVKTEFGKFGEVLAKTKKKLDEASSSIEMAETRTRQMTRKLKGVEALPETRVQALLGSADAEGDA
ncbi:MAG: DNA recombination protein RmuC [Roseateles asaccharophilus]|uniref:DNA recombination protein RmuC n=1 Tax=Roseateles asaccharophilus TaxID=582607 RepID=A0A4R6N7W0_9BURK|nr:DNA recombination protein RmuC [Roseateles asaccharophilus]MDN3546074.1 DNA recombination protein RmuC [Roseateles asaccharophilus]TDP11197.1 DNA recombination protein RmuC [Roseateles asaccharophilus]